MVNRGKIISLFFAVTILIIVTFAAFQLIWREVLFEADRFLDQPKETIDKEKTNENRPGFTLTYNQNYEELMEYYKVIPHIDEKVTDPLFWIGRLESPNEVLMSQHEIAEFNKRNIETYDRLVDIKKIDTKISRAELIKKIRDISVIPRFPRYNSAGRQLTNKDYSILTDKMNLNVIEENRDVKFGIAWKRTEMKTFPFHEPIYTKPGDYEFDIFMETAIYPLEPLAIYHESLDGQWYFVQMYNYTGWVPKQDIAIAEKEDLFRYIEHDDYLVVITGQMEIEVDGKKVLYDMGVRIPLGSSYYEDYYLGILPSRSEKGELKLNYVSIPVSSKIHAGPLPYTRANIIRQAFEFHCERYGWGGMFNARDCSAFIMDIYRSFGINLPRNASQQGRGSYGIFYSPRDLIPGTPIYKINHTMLYLGEYNGEHYIIHDFSGFYRRKAGKTLEFERVMRVLVTPLSINSCLNSTFKASLYTGRDFLLTD